MSDELSSPEALSRAILKGLDEGRYAPGQKLAERDLMERYGLGRSTVREGLGRLAASGVVEVIPHRGAMIRRLNVRQAVDVLRVAEALLGLTCVQAAEAVQAGADPQPLGQAALDYDSAEGPDLGAARARFYKQLTQLAGNHELTRLLPSMQIPLVRAQLPRAARGGHAELVAPILSGDPEGARAATSAHIGGMLQRIDVFEEPSLSRG